MDDETMMEPLPESWAAAISRYETEHGGEVFDPYDGEAVRIFREFLREEESDR